MKEHKYKPVHKYYPNEELSPVKVICDYAIGNGDLTVYDTSKVFTQDNKVYIKRSYAYIRVGVKGLMEIIKQDQRVAEQQEKLKNTRGII